MRGEYGWIEAYLLQGRRVDSNEWLLRHYCRKTHATSRESPCLRWTSRALRSLESPTNRRNIDNLAWFTFHSFIPAHRSELFRSGLRTLVRKCKTSWKWLICLLNAFTRIFPLGYFWISHAGKTEEIRKSWSNRSIENQTIRLDCTSNFLEKLTNFTSGCTD